MKLMVIASEHGKLYFNPQIEIDNELAYGLYHLLVMYKEGSIDGEIEVEEVVSEDEEEYEEL